MMTLSPIELAIMLSLEAWRTADELHAELRTQFTRESIDGALDFATHAGWIERFPGHHEHYLYRRTSHGGRVLRQQQASLARRVQREQKRRRASYA